MQMIGGFNDVPESLPPRPQTSALFQAARNAGARLLRLGASFRRRRPGDDSDKRAWTGTLGQVIADLDLLNRNTEQHFLEIGGKLTEFIQAVKLISSDLTVLADLESGAHASESLARALEYSRELQARNANYAGFGGMYQEAGRMRRTLSGFGGTVSIFTTLGMLTRTETARLGSAGTDLASLADDVKSLTENIQTRVSISLDLADSMIPEIERAMQEISAITEGQAESSISAISAAMASITSLRDVQNAALASSVRLAARFDAISNSFKKLIVSLQFHDITRQQVEHVIEVLRRLRAESEEHGGAVAPDRRRAVATLTLQSLQLADAGEKFSVSVASVLHSLDEIAGNVMQLAAESGTLAGISEKEKISLFLQIEKGCAAVLGGLAHYAKAETATRVASSGLAVIFDRMLEPIGEIQSLEIQMHRLAINASISAAHIGISGDALGVLADSIQQEAVESNQRSESLMGPLRAMKSGVVLALGQGGLPASCEPSILNESIEDMQAAVAKLHSSSERSFALISQIVVRGTRLGDDISARRASFSIGEVFARTVSGAREMLKDVEEKTRSGPSMDSAEGLKPELFDLDQKYTMQAQRDVHESHIRAMTRSDAVAVPNEKPVEQPLDTTELADGEGEEVGDNVEFF